MRVLAFAVAVIERARFFRIDRARSASESSYQRSERFGLFASLIDILHHSRKRQARRILGQYRYLIANTDQRATFGQSSNRDPPVRDLSLSAHPFSSPRSARTR
jgi:hypothetical protein